MRYRRVTALLLSLAAILAFFLWRNSHPLDPTFAGKPMSYWLNRLDDPASSANATNALRTIGPRGIPLLLDLLRARDLPDPAAQFVRSLGFETHAAEESHYKAIRAFEIINTNAAAAVPGLIQILQENHNHNVSSRIATLGCLSFIGPAAEPALPVIVQHLTNPVPSVRHNAVQAIGEIGGRPGFTIAPLTAALSDPVPSVRWCALFALRAYGSRARSAVPEIQKLWTDSTVITNTIGPDGTIITYPIPMTNMVANALWSIAPETTPRAFLVEAATPIVTNGVTTVTLKTDLDGKHQSLIPNGSHTPIVAWQRWQQTSPPNITLHLGQSDNDANDVLVGTFEVLCVADAAPDITTGYIIADGRIFLAARDNHRGQFLEIRRVN